MWVLLLLSFPYFLPSSVAPNLKHYKPLISEVTWVVPSSRELLYSARGLHGAVCPWWGGRSSQLRPQPCLFFNREWQPVQSASSVLPIALGVQGTALQDLLSIVAQEAVQWKSSRQALFWLTIVFRYARWYKMYVSWLSRNIWKQMGCVSWSFPFWEVFSMHHSGFFAIFCRLLLDVSGRLEDSRQRVLRMQSVQRESWYCKPESASTGQGGP